MSVEIGMPKACISCEHYSHKGYTKDELCPFIEYAHIRKERTPFGTCDLHKTNVFATEICNSYRVEPFVRPHPVENRPKPMSAIQEHLDI